MLITNAKIITWESPNRILEDYAILIQNGLIKEIGVNAELVEKYEKEEQLNAHSQYVMPGNICAHTHFYGAYARGMTLHGSAPDAFPQILEKLWWPLDKALTPEAVKYSALVCLIDAIRHGTTTLIDHHASPNCIDGSLDIIADATVNAGLRASLCYEVTDRNGLEGVKAGIRENVRFAKRMKQGNEDGLLSATFGLHASLTLSEETLSMCRDAAPDGIGFHIHVAEHSIDEYDSLQKSGMRVVDRLDKYGLLGDHSIVVHAVHIDSREMQILADTKTWVTHQPRSNMNNAVGLPDVSGMLRMGIRVGLGNDGFSNTMWDEWKTAYLAHKLVHSDPRWMPADMVAKMAIYNNRDLVDSIFNCPPVGIVAPGAVADLILVDYQPYTPLTTGNLPWQIIFGFNESMITTTMVNGKILMKDRQLVTLDEEKIKYEARKLAPDVWARYEAQF
jgi:putative selenium metabolism protein SsnA